MPPLFWDGFLLADLFAAGMAVFDTMRHIRPDVSTVCVGLAASMGAFLLASGHQVKPNHDANVHMALACSLILAVLE